MRLPIAAIDALRSAARKQRITVADLLRLIVIGWAHSHGVSAEDMLADYDRGL